MEGRRKQMLCQIATDAYLWLDQLSHSTCWQELRELVECRSLTRNSKEHFLDALGEESKIFFFFFFCPTQNVSNKAPPKFFFHIIVGQYLIKFNLKE